MKNLSKKLLAACLTTLLLLTPNLYVSAEVPTARNLSVFRVDGDDAFLARSLHGRGTVPREGQRLSLGNVMQTGLDTQVYMQLDTASIVKQDELTYVAVSAAGNLLSLSVLRGSALVDVQEMVPEHTLETRIGSTVMSVRGTIFTASIRDNGAAVITMLSGEGVVFVPDETGIISEQPLTAGYVIWAHDAEAYEAFELRPIDPRAMSLFELQEVLYRSEYLLRIGTITPAMYAQLPGLINMRQSERDARRGALIAGTNVQQALVLPPNVEAGTTTQFAGNVTTPSGHQRIAAGNANTFMICNNNILWAWGSNQWGKLGNDSRADSHIPIRILDNVIAVSPGNGHTAAIRSDGSLWTWGANIHGNLGDGTTTGSNTPIRVKENVVAVSTGLAATAAITSDGILYTWGANSFGALGDGTTIRRTTPVRIMDNVVAVSLTSNGGAAIRGDGSLWTWGLNRIGQLGDGTTTNRYEPVRVLDNVVAVSTGNGSTLAIRDDGSLWAMGTHGIDMTAADGQTAFWSHFPVRIMDNVIAVSAGGLHTTVLRSDGSLWAWGTNSQGRLGDGTTTTRSTPVRVMDNVAAISAGNNHTTAICRSGIVWTWGSNSNGQLGDGTTTNRTTPERVNFQ